MEILRSLHNGRYTHTIVSYNVQIMQSRLIILKLNIVQTIEISEIIHEHILQGKNREIRSQYCLIIKVDYSHIIGQIKLYWIIYHEGLEWHPSNGAYRYTSKRVHMPTSLADRCVLCMLEKKPEGTDGYG